MVIRFLFNDSNVSLWFFFGLSLGEGGDIHCVLPLNDVFSLMDRFLTSRVQVGSPVTMRLVVLPKLDDDGKQHFMFARNSKKAISNQFSCQNCNC